MIHHRWAAVVAVFAGFSAWGMAAPPSSAPATQPAAPRVTPLAVPAFPGSYAIWGATGGDSRGHVWFAVCAKDVPMPSARLYELIPTTGQLVERGDVVGELKRLERHRPGEGQMKIHTKILQAADGHLYFASMDEQGEKEDGSRLPTWGSHLWRLRLPENRWEHLLAAPEGIVAIAGTGRWIYALGYFGHVLYQYDVQTGQSRSLKVGSVDGHISRNLLADDRGHAFVPRLSREGTTGPVTVELVEFDPDLKERGRTPLANYLSSGKPTNCHGIVALERLAGGTLLFVTHKGWLYRIDPPAAGQGDAARVSEIGPIHPGGGESYTASLFASDGPRHLRAVSRAKGAKGYQWLRYDLETRQCEAAAFTVSSAEFPPLPQVLLYGSVTRDKQGAYYVVGTHMGRRLPIVLRVEDSEAQAATWPATRSAER